MNGTETKAPPAPTRLDRKPITPPAPAMPAKPGSWRPGLGRRLRSICSAEKPTKPANASDSQLVFSAAKTLPPPTMPPITMPGASASTIGQRTAPRLWCARTDDSEVNRMVPIEVAIAIWTMASPAKPRLVNSSVRNGTIIMPPPTPSSPAQKPVKAPSASRAGISTGRLSNGIVSASRCFCRQPCRARPAWLRLRPAGQSISLPVI